MIFQDIFLNIYPVGISFRNIHLHSTLRFTSRLYKPTLRYVSTKASMLALCKYNVVPNFHIASLSMQNCLSCI